MATKKKSAEQIAQQASICLKERDNIPTAPLWHLGKSYALQSVDSYDLLQNTIDYLACKAKVNATFTENEKEFLVNVYESLWWGGKIKGMPEAATLANHYVHGQGRDITLDPFLYKNSVIVQDAIICLKNYIAAQQKSNRPFAAIHTSDHGFQQSRFADPLRSKNRNQYTQGNIIANDGTLKAEEINARLKYTDNRFRLAAKSSFSRSVFFTKWSVDSLYDFVDYAANKDAENITEIPIGSRKLRLPDGLSNHMEKIGIAKKFWYRAEWHEHWRAA